MSWRAFRDADGAARRIGAAPEGQLRQGTLLLSFDTGALEGAYGPILRVGPRLEPKRIFAIDRRRDGDLSLLICDGAEVSHISTIPRGSGGTTILAYLWRCDTETAILATLSGEGRIVRRHGHGPVPAIGADQIAALFTSRHGVLRHPAIRAMALADHLMPVGPMPGLLAGSLVSAPEGPRSIETLRPGDPVLTADGRWTPVLWQGRAELPVVPGFRPVRLRAPYHGLDHDLVTLPDQLIQIGGEEVDQPFARDRILVRARDLIDGESVVEDPVRTATLHAHSVILSEPAAFNASGLWVESLPTAGLMRQPSFAALSVCPDLTAIARPTGMQARRARILAPYEVAHLNRQRAGRNAPVAH